jgi:protein required for attachment to host cells
MTRQASSRPKVETLWIVVAHRAGVRIAEYLGASEPLRLVHNLDHAAGRRKTGAIDSDSPGLAYSRVGQGGGHPMSPEVSAHEQAAVVFAREVAELLNRARNEHKYTQLILVAEPHFLGVLRAALDTRTASMVAHTLGKDLAHVELRDLRPHIQALLAP